MCTTLRDEHNKKYPHSQSPTRFIPKSLIRHSHSTRNSNSIRHGASNSNSNGTRNCTVTAIVMRRVIVVAKVAAIIIASYTLKHKAAEKLVALPGILPVLAVARAFGFRASRAFIIYRAHRRSIFGKHCHHEKETLHRIRQVIVKPQEL